MLLRAELITPPTNPVVTLEDAKNHLRVMHDDEDWLISSLVDAATAHLDGVGGVLGRALSPQTWDAVFCGSSAGDLPLGPVISRQPPVTVDDETTVRFVAGYASGVPAPIKAAILLHVGTLYQNREQDADSWIPTRAYEALLTPYRRWV